MTTLEIPFTLEQEVRYRQYFRDVLRQKNYQKRPFSYQTGVLVNMAVYELVKLGIDRDFGLDLFEDDIVQLRDAIDAHIDFEFLSDYALDWLIGEECEPYSRHSARRRVINEVG
jgi:hypothetical protein